MILHEYTKKDKENKNRLYVKLQCDHCGCEYERLKRFLVQTHGCSPKCLSWLKGERVLVTCAHCNLEHEKKKSQLNNSKSGLYFCSRKCKDEGQSYLEEIQPDHYGLGNGKYDYRQRALNYYGPKCNSCGYSANLAAIEVHHKDKNRDNNEINNLEVLCANCHAIHHRG